MVVSDVVCEKEPDAAIRNDDVLRGECIAGALTQADLTGLIEEAGFRGFHVVRRFPYRVVRNHPFHSMTYEARKPAQSASVRVMYRGPMRSVMTAGGAVLFAGAAADLPRDEAEQMGEQLFILGEGGEVTNVEVRNTCCAVAPDSRTLSPPAPGSIKARHAAGCMVCGSPLAYFSEERVLPCSDCGRELPANATCENGHFVCDACHRADALKIVESVCLNTKETDLLALLEEIKSHPAFPANGPEHHGLVPGVILAAYRNAGAAISDDMVRLGIRRGAQVPGGSCAFNGTCAAATGVGIAFGIMLDANPLKPVERQTVGLVTAEVMTAVASLEAARCCRRECLTALIKAAELSAKYLPVRLDARHRRACLQTQANRECIGRRCSFLDWKTTRT
jgi:hypothetical protein